MRVRYFGDSVVFFRIDAPCLDLPLPPAPITAPPVSLGREGAKKIVAFFYGRILRHIGTALSNICLSSIFQGRGATKSARQF
jgi:hypothetical protein